MGQGYKFSSVASRFKRQLAELMDALHRMEPHYIRCIKPNSFNRCAANLCLIPDFSAAYCTASADTTMFRTDILMNCSKEYSCTFGHNLGW